MHAFFVLLALALLSIPVAFDYRARRFLIWLWTFLIGAGISIFIPVFH